MLRETLQNTLKDAMKSHDAVTVSAVRLIIAGMKEKDVDIRGKGGKEAGDADLLSMMQSMIKQRNDSIKIYEECKRQDLANKEKAEIAVIEKFMPKQMDEAEATAAVKAVIAEINASSMKEMGAVMALLKTKYAGQMDFGKVSGLIKSLLG